MIKFSVLQQESTAPVLTYINTIRSYVLSKMVTFFLLYLSTFILFAIIRVVTGVSIKRMGFFSLRHISFSPSSDISISIRSLQIALRRPTFSKPNWFGIVIKDLQVNLTIEGMVKHKSAKKKRKQHAGKNEFQKHTQTHIEDDEDGPVWAFAPSNQYLARFLRFTLANAKFLDLTFINTSLIIKEHASINFGSFACEVDLRKSAKFAENSTAVGTLDRHKFKPGETAVVSRFTLRDMVVTSFSDPSAQKMTRDQYLSQTEFLDFFNFEVKGITDVSKLVLKDLAITFRVGTLNLNVDRFRELSQGIKETYRAAKEVEDDDFRPSTRDTDDSTSFSEDSDSDDASSTLSEEEQTDSEEPPTATPKLPEDISTFSRFGIVLVRIVKEVSVKFEIINVRHFSLVPPKSPGEVSDVKLACTIKDIMLDLRRLNPQNPSFRLFFRDEDSAHQAILSCNSVSVAFYHNNIQEEVLYIPMISSISKTNIFSKTIKIVKHFSTDEDENNSLLRTNINISTPSFNFKAHHFPILLQGLARKSKTKTHTRSRGFDFTNSTFQKLWPRAVIKFTIDEPAARIIVKPPAETHSAPRKGPQQALSSEFSGMVVVSCSKIYCDFSSSHINDNGEQNYSLKSSLHSSALEVFYQSNSGDRYDLLASDSFMVKIAAILNPTPSVICTADLGGMKISALHDEVLDGLQEVAHNFIRRKPKAHKKKDKPFPLRQFPAWLTHLYFRVSNVNVALATERTFETDVRHHEVLGLELGVGTFVIDYRSHMEEQRNLSLLHMNSEKTFFFENDTDNTFSNPELFHTSQSATQNKSPNSTDDRNLAITLEGIYGYKINNSRRDPNSLFLSIPRLSAAFFTTSDLAGPSIRTTVILRNANISWDFNLQYLIALTIYTITVIIPSAPSQETPKAVPEPESIDPKEPLKGSKELLNINVQTGVIRFKAKLPNNVNVMLETNSLGFQTARGVDDYASARVIRLYSDHPSVPNAWTRIFVLSDIRVTFKEKLSNISKPYPIDENEQILVELRSFRFIVASHLLLYRVFDNIISSFKGVAILAETAMSGKLKPGHAKQKLKMPKFPKIRLRSRAMFLGLEDDVFESKLALVFRVGLREQRLRLEKEEQFEAKVKAVLKKPSISVKVSTVSSTAPTQNASETLLRPAAASPRHASTQPILQPHEKEPAGSGPNKSSPNLHPPTRTATQTFGPLKGPNGLKVHNPIKNLHHSSSGIPNLPTFSNLTDLPQTLIGRRRHKQAAEPQNEILDASAPTSQSTVSIEVARHKLLENFSTSWIRAYRAAEANQKQSIRDQVDLSLGIDDVDPDTVANERIVDYSPYPFLFFVFINNADLLIRRPDFDEEGLRDFLHDVGKGQPRDTPFSLLIPLYLHLRASSLRVQIRDYPLPTVHFPELHPSQSPNITSMSINGNFIVAEGFSDKKANIRDIDVPLIPDAVGHTLEEAFSPFVARVKRTVASIKTFTSLQVHGRSHFPTRISHSQAYQPGMQAAMQVFETFSKPPIDPSEKTGFWDKIRLVFHARFQFNWKESDVHILLKGSNSPYHLLGAAAGFVMIWRNNVVLSINQSDDPKKLFSLSSDDYLFAVPNFSLQEREYLSKYLTLQNGLVCPTNFNESTTFQKVVMKLSGQVCWYVGMMFEREIERGTNLGRTFQFRPHYDVVLSKPEYVEDMSTYDAYRGFRSDYIHLAISVISPSAPEPTSSDDDSSTGSSYNSIHLSPMVFAHFHKWRILFDSASSLPVRNGKMFNFDGPMQKSKKFGRHLYTIKYQLLLSPMFITHAYLTSDFDKKTNTYSHHSTGLKAKIDSFTLDLHQRRSPNPGDELATNKRWRMHLNVGEMDFINTDLRVIQATFKEKSHQESLAKKFGFSSSPGSSISNGYSHSGSSSHYTGKIKISDNDYSWIDMDDFDELGETSPATIFPKINVSPMIYSPRWSYFRQTDHDDPCKYGTFIPFGSEDSHDCVIGNRPLEGSHKIILQARLSELEEQLKTNESMLESLTADLERFPGIKATSDRIKKVQVEIEGLTERITKVREITKERFNCEDEIDTTARKVAKNVELARKIYDDKSASGLGKKQEQETIHQNGNGNGVATAPEAEEDLFVIQPTETVGSTDSIQSEPEFDQQRIGEPHNRRGTAATGNSDGLFAPQETYGTSVASYRDVMSIGSANSLEPLDTIANPKGDSSFTNRFIVHGLHLKWNNEIRNSVSHYLARVSERKKQAYYITRRAVKYLEDLAEKHSSSNPADGPVEISNDDIECFLRELNATAPNTDPHFNNMLDDIEGHLSAFDASLATVEGNYEPDEKYLIRLTSPQIQLVSDVNPDSAVLVTSENIQLKVIEIVDTERALGDQSRVLESRYGVFLQDAQFYVLSAENVRNHAYLYFSHHTYGCGKSPMWPPWLAVECCYDDQALKEFLIINKTSATMRYDKPNSLRVQKMADTKELQNACTAALIRHEMHHQNRIAVDFPKIVATTNSSQFFAAYTIVIDLILYSEPVKKQHSEQLDKVLLTTDFNDLKKAINQVKEYQTKLRKFDEIRMEYLARMSELDESSVRDLAKVELVQDNLGFELGIIVVAIKTGMQKNSRDDDFSQSFKWAIAADQIIWHVLDQKQRPFMDVGLADASFNRVENTDGFNANSVEVGMMQAFNLETNAVYPEIFSPYVAPGTKFDATNGKLISVNWTMLEPIGGIPIMEKFEVALRPLKIQFERNTWDKVFSFIFPKNPDGTHDDHPIFPSKNKGTISSTAGSYDHFSDSESDSDYDDLDSVSDVSSSKKSGSVKQDSESDTTSLFHKKIQTLNPFQQKLASGSASIRSGSIRSNRSPRKSREVTLQADTPESSKRSTNCSFNGSSNSVVNSEDKNDDDIAVMVKRASNYMAIVNIHMVETTVCVSYKGQGSRNFLDLHEFVLKLPAIRYQNKTWSNMDLVLHLKKDITKILLSHSGSLIGNKIKKHHARQRGPQLHQISNYVSFMSVDDLAKDDKKAGASKRDSQITAAGPSSPLAMINEGDKSSNSLLKYRSRAASMLSTDSSAASVDVNSIAEVGNGHTDDEKHGGKKRHLLKRLLN